MTHAQHCILESLETAKECIHHLEVMNSYDTNSEQIQNALMAIHEAINEAAAIVQQGPEK